MNIPGPAGVLQAELTPAPDRADITRSATMAILCHPHPQYGGNMHDMVLATLEAALLAGLESGPAAEWTSQEWQDIRQRVSQRNETV